MRATRVLAIAVALGFGVSFVASANVVYDSETTNAWFGVNMSELTTAHLSSAPWSLPPNGGEAAVVSAAEGSANVIRLDTDLDDPLTYSVTTGKIAEQEDVAVVAAEMTATVNATEPQISANPQAALAVIGTATATNWVGLVGTEGGETGWVTFQSPVPVAGETYSVRIEFDQRPGEARRIRYLVEGTVLGDGWYLNPKESPANISSVSFSGSGDIAALDGENITENTITFNAPTESEGYDFTNGTISVSAVIDGYESATAVLKVVDFTTGVETTFDACALVGGSPASWDLSALTAGGIYDYTIEAKVGNKVVATKTGTFTAAKWPTDVWFGADASKSTPAERVKGGSWDVTEPTIEDRAYVIEDGALFNVDDQKPGSNHVTRVDAVVTFESLVDANTLGIEEDALGGFVAAKSGEVPQWMALTSNTEQPWTVLTGALAPEVNVPYVIRAEIDFLSSAKRVRYLVSNDGGANFQPLANGAGEQWIPLADATKGTLAKVELKGAGSLAKFEAKVADKALAKVGNTEYDSMDEALAAAKDNGKPIILLTSATIEPKVAGTYEIAPGAYQYVSGGKVSSDPKTIVVTEPGQPPVVRPSAEEMKSVTTPEGKQFKDINKLREFLEKNKVEAYTKDNADPTEITDALKTVPTDADANGLALWQDYALGINKTDPVAPVTIPTGDTNPNKITLSIPKVAAATPSGDYSIAYEVVDKDGKKTSDPQEAGEIQIPLDTTGTYTIKAVFTPAN